MLKKFGIQKADVGIGLYLLAAITCAPLVITSGIQCCNIVFTVTNHLRTNSLLVLGTGLLNIICVIAGKKLFDLDFFSVVIFSGAGILLRNLFYTAPRTATLTGFPCFTYFGGIVKSVVCVGVTILAGAVFIRCIPAESWPSLAADVLLTSLFAAAANVFILFSMRQIHDFASASWRRLHFAHNN